MFGGFHWYDLIPLALIALLIWGPKRLPEMGSSIGKTIKEFQKSMREVKEPEAPPTSAIPPAPPAATPELPSATPVSATTETPKE
jgi:sec-independent protein translocase protein TatA